MKTKKFTLIFILIFSILAMLFTACSQAAPAYDESAMSMQAPQPDSIEEANDGSAVPLNTASETILAERIIIYQGEIELVVTDVSQAMEEVTQMATVQGGYVSASNIYQTSYSLQGSITIRIDAQKYQETLVKLRAIGIRTLRENTSSQDVTEEYVDLEARKTNLERTEQALQQLLETHQEGNKIDDILEVSRELTRVRGEIEQIEGKMRYLQNQASLATITVQLYPEEDPEPEKVAEQWKPYKVAEDAWTTLISILRTVGDGLIWVIICGIPLLILILIPLVLIRFAYLRWRKTKVSKEA